MSYLTALKNQTTIIQEIKKRSFSMICHILSFWCHLPKSIWVHIFFLTLPWLHTIGKARCLSFFSSLETLFLPRKARYMRMKWQWYTQTGSPVWEIKSLETQIYLAEHLTHGFDIKVKNNWSPIVKELGSDLRKCKYLFLRDEMNHSWYSFIQSWVDWHVDEETNF